MPNVWTKLKNTSEDGLHRAASWMLSEFGGACRKSSIGMMSPPKRPSKHATYRGQSHVDAEPCSNTRRPHRRWRLMWTMGAGKPHWRMLCACARWRNPRLRSQDRRHCTPGHEGERRNAKPPTQNSARPVPPNGCCRGIREGSAVRRFALWSKTYMASQILGLDNLSDGRAGVVRTPRMHSPERRRRIGQVTGECFWWTYASLKALILGQS